MQVPKPYLDYLTDPSFEGVNELFVLSFENDTDRTVQKNIFFQIIEKCYHDGQNLFGQDHAEKIAEKIADHDHDKYITTQEFNKLTSGKS